MIIRKKAVAKKETTKITAIILSAGMGTRMKSNIPKVLHTIASKPMIYRIVDTVINSGVNHLIFVIGFKGNLVKNAITERYGKMLKNFEFIVQRRRLGTGHAIKVVIEKSKTLSKNILVLMGDMPLISSNTLKKMMAIHAESSPLITIATCLTGNKTGFGRIIRNEKGQIIEIKEEKECLPEQLLIDEINTGIYVFSIDFLKKNIRKLSNNNVKKEYYLTDLISIASKIAPAKIASLRIPPHEAIGVNKKQDIEEVEAVLRN